MDDARAKAFEFAQEATKQVLTLSTGILALSVTFVKDSATGAPTSARPLIEVAWGFYLVSVFFGIFAMLALAGNLERPGADGPSIYRRNITVPSMLQLILFFLGLSFTLAFGVQVT
jgi:hypothetical protein